MFPLKKKKQTNKRTNKKTKKKTKNKNGGLVIIIFNRILLHQILRYNEFYFSHIHLL